MQRWVERDWRNWSIVGVTEEGVLTGKGGYSSGSDQCRGEM